MKGNLVVAGLLFVLFACNNNTSTGDTSSNGDSSNHAAHQPDADDTNSGSGRNYMKDMHDAMSKMMQQMQQMQPTGDPDHDFAMMMKHHHEGAIDMAEAEVAGGTDATLQQMARNMIEEQRKENAGFDRILQRHQPSGTSDFGRKAMGMMTPMSDIKMEGGSLDAMFASMMIPHHQDAVQMSQEYLKLGKNEELKKIARDIIQSQPKEIGQLQQWLNSHKG